MNVIKLLKIEKYFPDPLKSCLKRGELYRELEIQISPKGKFLKIIKKERYIGAIKQNIPFLAKVAQSKA